MQLPRELLLSNSKDHPLRTEREVFYQWHAEHVDVFLNVLALLLSQNVHHLRYVFVATT